MQKIYDAVIIGAGIAGITSAIYLKRAGLDIVIIDSYAPGGQLNKISTIENYPGFKQITGPELSQNLYEQLKQQQIEYKYGKAEEIIDKTTTKIVKTDQEQLETKYIILALGRTPNKLNIEKEDKLLNKGISYCALCDGPLFKNKNVAVVGSGNSAIEESLYLSKICNKITILIRNDKIKAEEKMVQQLKNRPNIEIKYNTQIKEIIEENNKLKAIKTNNETIEVQGLFIYIGSTPNTKFLPNIETENKFIKVDKNMKTSIDKIYAVGDVIKKDVYQLTTAASDATIAAIAIKNEINN
ncbi:MAG: FAD-dependent oxidoreductase [Bacilli bacterium]|nr:FAD-dependent oxidoreductase [Bacilli bacterium]